MKKISEIFDGSDAELLPETTRLERLEALGYSSESEYEETQRTHEASRQLGADQVASVFTV
jgi:hypothetical protein